jgi:PAS domain S-box-containing protein
VTIGDRRFLQAVIRDISEAKRHETILAVSRERLRRLIDSLPDPAWMKDKTGHYIAANQALADYLGVRVNALIGKSSADFFAPELAAAFAQNERNVIETGIQSRSVRSFETVRGERWYDTVVVAIAEDGADDYGTAGITRDVTELRSAARETQRHAEEMSTLMEDIPDPIVRIDHGYRFIYANRAAQVFAADYGLEVSDRPVRSSGIPAEGVDSLERHLAAAFESRQQQRFELGILSTDGSVMLEILLQPEIDALGGVISVLAIGRDISQRKKLEQERGRHEQQLRDMLVQTIHSMALTVEKRDPYTAGHQGRVADLAVAIGHELGLSEHSIQGLRLGSMIHDIGKIYIPAEILNRPGRLTPQEMALIRTHPEVGYDIVKDIDFIWPVKEVILQHHERPDGSGYPGGLKGDEIALEARIVAAADVMEAISSHRPYRPALGVERGLEEIRKGRGARYDPDVVDACLGLFAEKRFAFRAE